MPRWNSDGFGSDRSSATWVPPVTAGRRQLGLTVVGLGVAVTTVLGAAQPPAGVEAQSIRYPSTAGVSIEAYLVTPDGASDGPAVILVHDDLGANDTFRELAHALAAEGFVVLVPHLPSRIGVAAAEPVDGRPPPRTPVTELGWHQSVDDLIAAVAYLQQVPAVDAARVSALGVGWGEFHVWKLAEKAPTLSRVVVYYGLIPTDDVQLQSVRADVLGHYAEQDYLATARVLRAQQVLGDRFTYHIYPTVPGFLGGGTGRMQQPTSGYVTSLAGSTPDAVAAAAEQAWRRTVAFLHGSGP